MAHLSSNSKSFQISKIDTALNVLMAAQYSGIYMHIRSIYL